MKNNWYKDVTFYQIWPRSFADGNNDGIGDLYGIYDKLEYIKSLGVGAIWLSPIYPSPQDDYGYDISDYYSINPEYGDMEIFQKVVDKTHELGMKLIMDLVVNHTSDEHEWFIKSHDKDSPYHDYYFWRAGKNGKEPNNWDSLFEGKAWKYDEQMNEYYLHLFTNKQVDLNMDNPQVRQEVIKIMKFWLDKGVDGFREDVITLISKPEGLPNDKIPVQSGLWICKNGPHIHEYLKEFREATKKYDCLLLGEAPMMNTKTALKYIDETNGDNELDLMFHFQHMEADCFMSDYIPMPFNLLKLKKAFSKWQKDLDGKAWNTLYMENHDHPRVISRYGSEKYHDESGKMIACSYLLQKGTPFIYQGQEIGMTNMYLDSIDDYKDCMIINHYKKECAKGFDQKKFDKLRKATRDNSRTIMQWGKGEYANFSRKKPWFACNDNHVDINVAAQEKDENSLLNFYRQLVLYRNQSSIVRYGDYHEFNKNNPYLYVYERNYQGESLLVICNYSPKNMAYTLPIGYQTSDGKLIFQNYADCNEDGNRIRLRPYETRVYYFGEQDD